MEITHQPDRILPRIGAGRSSEDGAVLLGVRNKTARDFRAWRLLIDFEKADSASGVTLPPRGLEYLVALYHPGGLSGQTVDAYQLINVSPYCFDTHFLERDEVVTLREESGMHYATLDQGPRSRVLLGASKSNHIIRPLPCSWLGWRAENILESPPDYPITPEEHETARLRYARMMHDTMQDVFTEADLHRYVPHTLLKCCPRAGISTTYDFATNAQELITDSKGFQYYSRRILQGIVQSDLCQRHMNKRAKNPDGTLGPYEPDLEGIDSLERHYTAATTLGLFASGAGGIAGISMAFAGISAIGIAALIAAAGLGVASLNAQQHALYVRYLLRKDVPFDLAAARDDDSWDA